METGQNRPNDHSTWALSESAQEIIKSQGGSHERLACLALEL